MLTIKSKSTITMTVLISLTEQEARALQDFARFGAYSDTMKFINEHWGNEINAKELKNFFDTAFKEIGPHIEKFDKAQKLLNV
jgi:hypothetical protein